jgi:hypothetical protein
LGGVKCGGRACQRRDFKAVANLKIWENWKTQLENIFNFSLSQYAPPSG